MIQVMRFLRRCPELSLDEFRRWWPEAVGAPLAGDARTVRCMLSVVFEEEGDSGAAYHGLSQFWFATEKDARGFLASSEVRDTLLCVEAQGILPEATIELVTRDHLILEQFQLLQRSPFVSAIYAIKRKKGMPVADFQEYYRNHHTRYSTELPDLRVYYQFHVIESEFASGEPNYDGVTINWFDDRDSLARMQESPELQRGLEDSRKFLEMSKILALTGEDQRLLWPR